MVDQTSYPSAAQSGLPAERSVERDAQVWPPSLLASTPQGPSPQPQTPSKKCAASSTSGALEKCEPAGNRMPMSVQVLPPSFERYRRCLVSCAPARSVLRSGSVKSTVTRSLCPILPSLENVVPESVVL